ncbi:MAG: nicotinate (nicotinamide) nucleotide adenylyltransferase [Planctomycetes bacterium]|nr:nicotinate (nicotinamide) nucleotide adenylyltransferase [Planctomycetota bacterium]MCP4771694.1 nicotinate (nicotinamide) nucleotide adenylyltransferase [Planctomycetota bacterium]MCP4860006.1 nicotinate (nicotinamide) nucleotide adenylyltransferase [Planctomycetota bacterium]
MKLVVFGGSFDPVHEGHVAMANAIQEHQNPDLLLWVPSYHAPHKTERPPAVADWRLTMLDSVVARRTGEEVCRLEIEREGLSFTVDTLRQLEKQYGVAHPTLLLGADSLQHLLTWRDVPELFERVRFVFVPRPGWGESQLQDFRIQLSDELRVCFHAEFLPMQEVAVSSTEIREALALGQMPEGLAPSVREFIRAQGCYGFTKA